MASEALRSVVAELGLKLDDAGLDAFIKKIDGAIQKEKALSDEEKRVEAEAKKRAEEEKKRAADAKKRVEEGVLFRARGIRYDRKETEDAQKWASDAFGDLRGNAEKALGGRIFGMLTRASSGFAAFAQRIGLTGDKMAALGQLAVRVSGIVVGAIAAMGYAAVRFAQGFEESAAALRQASRDAGTTTTQLQALTYAGERAGVSADTMRGALASLNDGLFQAARGTGGPISAFHRLGIRVRDARGQVRATADVMDDLTRALPRVQNPMRQLAIAQEFWGSSARDMLQVVNAGPAALAAWRAEFESLVGITPEATEASRQFGQAQMRLRYAFDGVRSSVMTALAPAVTWVTEKFARFMGFIARVTRHSRLLHVAFTALGVAAVAAAAPVIVAWAPVIGTVLAITVAVVGLGLAFDDLAVFIEGGDSVLGDFLDRMGGVGTAASTSRGLRDAWDGVGAAIRDARGATDEFRTAYGQIDAAVRPVLRRVVDAHREAFRLAFGGVGESFDEVWNRIVERVMGLFTQLRDRVSGFARSVGLTSLADRVAGAFAESRGTQRQSAVGRLGSLAQDLTSPLAIPALVGEWHNILTSRPAPQVPARPAGGEAGRERRARGGARTTTNHNTFHIHGPDAREVANEIERRQRAQRDADAPQGPED